MNPVPLRFELRLDQVASCPICRRLVIVTFRPAVAVFRDEEGNPLFGLPTAKGYEPMLLDPSWLSRKRIRDMLGHAVVARQGFAEPYEFEGRAHHCGEV